MTAGEPFITRYLRKDPYSCGRCRHGIILLLQLDLQKGQAGEGTLEAIQLPRSDAPPDLPDDPVARSFQKGFGQRFGILGACIPYLCDRAEHDHREGESRDQMVKKGTPVSRFQGPALHERVAGTCFRAESIFDIGLFSRVLEKKKEGMNFVSS